MQKILIVDDEYIVRLGLKTIVDWAGFGYAVAGEAANGKEAFDFLQHNPVDVILTDIKMPVMDGLELTRKIRATDKKVRIIILSHYDEFSYAQEAVKLGAFRYILKSELTKTNLENVLKSLHLDADVSPVSALSPMAEQKGEKYLEAFINEEMLPSFSRHLTNEKEDAGKAVYAPPPGTNEWVVLSVSCRSTALLDEAKEKFPKTLKVLFEDAFEKVTGKGRYYDDHYQFAAVVTMAIPKDADTGVFLHEKTYNPCLRIVKTIRRYYGVNLFIGISAPGKREDWWRLLREAHKARVDCYFSRKLFVGVFSGDMAGGSQKRGLVSYTKLVALIDANQKDAMLEYIRQIFHGLRKSKDYAAVDSAFGDFLSVGKLIHEKYQLEEEASLNENKFKHDAFFDMPFIDDTEIYIYELFLSLLSAKQNGKAGYSHIVKKCIDYIEENFEHNIGLSEAAKYAEVSQSYLSFMFKQETGVNFNAALTQYRIEKAKHLLLGTSLKIYQVAERVGFSNPYYFSKVFREISGYTCKEYRDREGK
ncbi:MAG: response regulator [Spirochaetaceae bacterium]|jgi:two-component system response regulator YesN|nr:response regulator [Spirochaetaceae bacterium]